MFAASTDNNDVKPKRKYAHQTRHLVRSSSRLRGEQEAPKLPSVRRRNGGYSTQHRAPVVRRTRTVQRSIIGVQAEQHVAFVVHSAKCGGQIAAYSTSSSKPALRSATTIGIGRMAQGSDMTMDYRERKYG